MKKCSSIPSVTDSGSCSKVEWTTISQGGLVNPPEQWLKPMSKEEKAEFLAKMEEYIKEMQQKIQSYKSQSNTTE